MPGAARYAVYRFDASGGCADTAHRIALTGGTSFTDPSAEPGHAYVYRVTSVDRLWHESGSARTA